MRLKTTHGHTAEAIRERLSEKSPDTYLREWVYGGIDGVVTTFAVVSGVVGADLSISIILILGAANLIGDGFAMAVGCYSSTKTDNDNYERLKQVETDHIENSPECEKEEIRQIYSLKGFSGDILEDIVATVTKDRAQWIKTMMVEEYGLLRDNTSAVKAAYHTFLAFVICGSMPLLPFLFNIPNAVGFALLLSSVTFFAIGAFKSLWSIKSWLWHGIETALVGLCAAGLAFLIGYWLNSLGFGV